MCDSRPAPVYGVGVFFAKPPLALFAHASARVSSFLMNRRYLCRRADWFEGLNVKTQVANPTYLESVNMYGVHCGGDLHMWESSGWIKECDPYGWFQVGWEIILSHTQRPPSISLLVAVIWGSNASGTFLGRDRWQNVLGCLLSL